MSERLTGWQARETWMGAEVLTLADVWPQQPRAMIVGLNPAPASVAAGHYYQGKVGQLQLRRLVKAGLFPAPPGRHFENAAVSAGVGFTDIVKRPSRGEGDVGKDEIAYGASRLGEKLASHGVPLIVCVFRHPVVALLGSAGVPGTPVRHDGLGCRGVPHAGTVRSAGQGRRDND